MRVGRTPDEMTGGGKCTCMRVSWYLSGSFWHFIWGRGTRSLCTGPSKVLLRGVGMASQLNVACTLLHCCMHNYYRPQFHICIWKEHLLYRVLRYMFRGDASPKTCAMHARKKEGNSKVEKCRIGKIVDWRLQCNISKGIVAVLVPQWNERPCAHKKRESIMLLCFPPSLNSREAFLWALFSSAYVITLITDQKVSLKLSIAQAAKTATWT